MHVLVCRAQCVGAPCTRGEARRMLTRAHRFTIQAYSSISSRRGQERRGGEEHERESERRGRRQRRSSRSSNRKSERQPTRRETRRGATSAERIPTPTPTALVLLLVLQLQPYRMMKSVLHSERMRFSLRMCSCCFVSTMWCFLSCLSANVRVVSPEI